MKLKEKMKRFWTMDVHNHEGFTLVELIIVIAILAILSSVAVVGYSAYVEKANKQADMTLVAEVSSALTLYYYDNLGSAAGYVILSADGDVETDTNGVGASAMEAAFGSNWRSLRLKYAGWIADCSVDAYKDSTFQGNEVSLLQQVGNLTETMKEVLIDNPELAGDGFRAFLQELELDLNDPDDAQAIANAAVLYVAQNTQSSNTDPDKVTAAFSSYYEAKMNDDGDLLQLVEDLSSGAGLGNLGACAAIYAQAEAFCQYVAANGEYVAPGEKSLLEQFHEKTAKLNAADNDGNVSQDNAVKNVADIFGFVVDQAMQKYPGAAYNYVYEYNQASKDSLAFLDAMGVVTDNKDILVGRLDMKDCFTDGFVENLLVSMVGIQDGQILILIDADGKITVNPGEVRG